MTVEELRGTIVNMAQGVSYNEMGMFLKYLTDYAAAAKEEERERIRNANGVLRLENDDAHAVWVTAGEYFILPASLLSPAPKEST
jgi:hypothetical protein